MLNYVLVTKKIAVTYLTYSVFDYYSLKVTERFHRRESF